MADPAQHKESLAAVQAALDARNKGVADFEKPFVNLNGDRATTLTDQFAEIDRKFRDLLDTMGEHAPHGRNYFADNYQRAREVHLARMRILQEMQRTYAKLAEYTSDFIK